MPSVVSMFRSSAGLELRVRQWTAAGTPRARLLLVHGLAEHSGRYERTGALLAAAGIETRSFDLRGFGASGGRRADIRHWDDYLDDVQAQLAAMRGELPVVLMGHSLGGLICLTYAMSDRPAPDLLVLSAPAIGTSVPGLLRTGVGLLGKVTPGHLLDNRLLAEQLSRDPAVGEAYFADPLVYPRSSARLAANIFAAMGRARRGHSGVTIPTFVVHGSADPIVPAHSTERLATRAGVERRVYPDMRHETLNEPEGPQVVADIVDWIRRSGGAAAG